MRIFNRFLLSLLKNLIKDSMNFGFRSESGKGKRNTSKQKIPKKVHVDLSQFGIWQINIKYVPG